MVPIFHRIVVAGSIGGHVVMNSSRVFLFDQEYGLSQEEVIQECLCVCAKKHLEAGITTSYAHIYLCICVDKSIYHMGNELICNCQARRRTWHQI